MTQLNRLAKDRDETEQAIDGDRRALLASLGAVAAGGVAAGPAAGQETETPTPTPTNGTRNSTDADLPSRREQAERAAQTAIEQAQEEQETPTYLARVDSNIRVVDYDVAPSERLENQDVEKSRVSAVLEADNPAAITKTDAFGAFATRGVNSIFQETEAIPGGRTEVALRATVVRGVVGMGISTDSGGVGISSGVPADGDDQVGLTHGVATGLGTALTGTFAVAWRRYRDDLHEPEDWGEDSNGGLL